ncbi:MAG: hypothetical protein ABL984_06740 [Pyrinomonadaceae bacterium]
MNEYIDELRGVIKRLHDCEAVYLETVPVTEAFQGKTVWQGEVEVFTVQHPKASRCYAWAYETDTGGKRFMAVLEIPPVDSPQTAVKAAIVSDAREKA